MLLHVVPRGSLHLFPSTSMRWGQHLGMDDSIISKGDMFPALEELTV